MATASVAPPFVAVTPPTAALSAVDMLRVALKIEVPGALPEICVPVRIWRFPVSSETEVDFPVSATTSVRAGATAEMALTVPLRATAIESVAVWNAVPEI